MKELLVFLITLSVLFSVAGVIAETQTQNVSVSVAQTINVVITPSTVNFGSAVMPGTTVTGDTITFNPANSNVNLIVVYASVSGKPFEDNLLLGGKSPGSTPLLDITCTKDANGICTYTSPTVVPTLAVPVGFAAGTFNGAITYTITGTTP